MSEGCVNFPRFSLPTKNIRVREPVNRPPETIARSGQAGAANYHRVAINQSAIGCHFAGSGTRVFARGACGLYCGADLAPQTGSSIERSS